MKAISRTARAHDARPPAEAPRRTYRADYRPPEYTVEHIDLRFELALPITRVTAMMSIVRADGQPGALVFNGERLHLRSLRLNDRPLPSECYAIDEHGLTIFDAPATCRVEVVTELEPADNAGLEGLNHAADVFFTHCEPEGFRRITYFPDRPDVMARYTCTLIADAAAYPTLLSNGDLVEGGPLPDGRHYARWNDPFPKATYVFALVAGRFETLTDSFLTRSGKNVAIAIHAAAEELPYCAYGLTMLKRAMAWDERVYGREYDLDVLNVVVMRSYPGGAMECKGLNLYASEFFVGSPRTSSDEDLMRVAAIIGHEYFHNWTGNRVGCRDWFELSLKEGFTVYRQQQFMAAMFGATAMRIDDVVRLRELQFPEDEGGMAHAVRPDSYLAINNFYTRTIYEKGAEIIRMMSLVVGDRLFHDAAQAFFERCDGRAVTIDALIDTVEEISGVDLAQFRRWYDTVGRPNLRMSGCYHAESRRYELKIRQELPRGADAGTPLHIPLRLGLVGSTGEALLLKLSGEAVAAGTDRVLQLRGATEVLTFEDVPQAPIPSLLRGFSAPVQMSADLDDEALALLAMQDSDGFNRWEMARELATRTLLRYASGAERDTRAWLQVMAQVLDEQGNHALLARLIELPSVQQLGLQQEQIDVDGLHAARLALSRDIAAHLRERLRDVHERTRDAAQVDAAAGTRRLRNRCLAYLLCDPRAEDLDRCARQLRESERMEDALAALKPLVERGGEDRDDALHWFHERWQGVDSVIDRWFSIQAGSEALDCAVEVERLMRHPDYSLDNATRLKAIFDTFTLNTHAFHERSGLGYDLVIRTVLALSEPNPRLAARFLKRFDGWHRHDALRRAPMVRALQRVLATRDTPKDLYEIATMSLRFGERSLAAANPVPRRDR